MRRFGLTLLVVMAGCSVGEGAVSAADPPETPLPPAAASTPVASVAPDSTNVAATEVDRPDPTVPETTTLPELQGLELVEVANGFDQPVTAVSPPGDERVFVVERSGAIRALGADQPFLDLDDRVNSEDGIEPGLLGLAFHPDFATNGLLYVYYYAADAPETRLSSFVAEGDAADPDSERILRRFDQPTNRHNGGMLQFDEMGRLFVSLGEGGAAATHAQDPSTPLGAILRFDLDPAGGLLPAAGNPFLAGGGDPAVWAYGMRNPWRFDLDDGLLYIGDVGQEDWEEVDIIAADGVGGENLGWLEMEGSHCFRVGCDPEAFTLPAVEYGHDEGCSITGGVVSRGAGIPELAGHYLYGDWCGGWVRSFRWSDGVVTEAAERFSDVGQINGFGTGAAGEVYVMTYDGRIMRIDAVR